jgi:hypothetical protein
MTDSPREKVASARALSIAKGLIRTKRASNSKEGEETTTSRFLRLRAIPGAFYWISLDGRRVLRGDRPDRADELQPGFIDAMVRAGRQL